MRIIHKRSLNKFLFNTQEVRKNKALNELSMHSTICKKVSKKLPFTITWFNTYRAQQMALESL